MRWLIDGMNVIGSRPDGWWKDRDAAMARLVASVERWAATTSDEVTIVFERPPRPPLDPVSIEVAHARRPGADAADDEIVRRLRIAGGRPAATVVTSDRGLAERARAAGASVEPVARFRRRIESP